MNYPTSIPLAEFSHLADFAMGRSTLPKSQLVQDGWTCEGFALGVAFPVAAGPSPKMASTPQAAAPMSAKEFDDFVKDLHKVNVPIGQPLPSFTIPPGLWTFLIALLKQLLGIP